MSELLLYVLDDRIQAVLNLRCTREWSVMGCYLNRTLGQLLTRPERRPAYAKLGFHWTIKRVEKIEKRGVIKEETQSYLDFKYYVDYNNFNCKIFKLHNNIYSCS